MFGLEGIYLKRLLEHGWVGYILYLCLWFSLLIYLVKHLKKNKKTAALGISIWIVYFAFANMTGELQSAMPTLTIIGSVIGILSYKEIQKLPELQ